MEDSKTSGAASAASAAKATPGPWVVRHGICSNDHPDTSADVHGPRGQFVANCGCHEQTLANANLIATAPEMADLLYGQWEVERCLDEECEEHGPLVNVLRAAGRIE